MNSYEKRIDAIASGMVELEEQFNASEAARRKAAYAKSAYKGMDASKARADVTRHLRICENSGNGSSNAGPEM